MPFLNVCKNDDEDVAFYDYISKQSVILIYRNRYILIYTKLRTAVPNVAECRPK